MRKNGGARTAGGIGVLTHECVHDVKPSSSCPIAEVSNERSDHMMLLICTSLRVMHCLLSVLVKHFSLRDSHITRKPILGVLLLGSSCVWWTHWPREHVHLILSKTPGKLQVNNDSISL